MMPPFTYFGGKTLLAPRIARLLPAHTHYVEPFAGSLAVLLAKPQARQETVNDLDGDLVNFWRVLRDRPAELARACLLTPHSRAELAASMTIEGDELERARRVFVRLTQARSRSLASSPGWRFHVGPNLAVPGFQRAYVARLGPVAARLREVSLDCRPAVEIVERYGQHPRVLIYADPPYLGSVRNGDYGTDMRGEDEHRELAAALASCKAAVVLSGYASPLYDEIYAGWHRAELATHTSNGTGDKRRVEVLWSNRPLAGELGELGDQRSAELVESH